MKGNYLGKLSLLVLANLVIKPVWILYFEITIQNRVGLEDYGAYAALFYLSLIFQILLDLGLQTHIVGKVVENPQRLSYLLPGTLVAKAVLGILYLGILMLVGVYMGYDSSWLSLLALLGVAQLGCSLSLYMRSMVTALQQYGMDIILSVLDRVLMIVFCTWLLFWPGAPEFTLERFVYVQIAAYLISALISMGVLLRKSSVEYFRIQKFKHVLMIIRQGIPFAVLILLMAVFMRSDLVILERLMYQSAPEDPGRYKQAERLLDAANNFSGVLLASWLLPLFSKFIVSEDKIRQLAGLVTGLILPLACIVVLYSIFYGEDVMQFCYTGYQQGDGKLLTVFLCAFPFYCLTYIFSTLNTALRLVGVLIRLALLTCIISVVLNLVFVPLYGVWATACIAIITQAVYSLGNVIVYMKRFKVSVFSANVLKAILLLCLIAPLIAVVKQFDTHFLVALIIVVSASVVGMRILGLLKPSDWNLVQQEI